MLHPNNFLRISTTYARQLTHTHANNKHALQHFFVQHYNIMQHFKMRQLGSTFHNAPLFEPLHHGISPWILALFFSTIVIT
jgi:hypothetical protein